MDNRRVFLKKLSGITAGLMLPLPYACTSNSQSDALGQILPLRKLGATGEKVTMLGVGGFHVGWTTEKDAVEVIETAIEGGIRFFDTAHNYGKGSSEERYGNYLVPKYRDHIFLMTKTQAQTGENLIKEVDLSLKRLKTDQVDLLQLHSFRSPEDVEARMASGVMDAIYKIKEVGKARHIGFTGHQDPGAHVHMMQYLDKYPEFATLQMPINVLDHHSEKSFINKALAAGLENNLGILAMKTLADGRFFSKKEMSGKLRWETETPVIPGNVSIREAMHFVWSLPVSVLITGAENSTLLKEKIELAKEFTKLSENDRISILEQAAKADDARKVEYYKKLV